MKTVVKICLFLVLVNIFIPMIASLGFFYDPVEGDQTYYHLGTDEENLPTDDEGFQRVAGYSFSSLTNIGIETFAVLGLSVLVGLALMKVTSSISPLIVSLFFATFFNIYRRSSNLLSSFQINPYIVLAFTVVMLIMFLYTMVEYFHQGDASDS